MQANEILDREFLEIRSRLLDIGASLDRIDRAPGDTDADRRMALIGKAIGILSQSGADRANQLQMLFSREYDSNWQARFGFSPAVDSVAD